MLGLSSGRVKKAGFQVTRWKNNGKIAIIYLVDFFPFCSFFSFSFFTFSPDVIEVLEVEVADDFDEEEGGELSGCGEFVEVEDDIVERKYLYASAPATKALK